MKTSNATAVLRGALLALLAVFSYVIHDTFTERIIGVGDRAPAFELKTDKGQTVTQSSFGGKLLVLNFWATWCPPCIQELPTLNEFQRRLADRGVVVLGISVDKDEKKYAQFLSRVRVAFTTARDPEARVPAGYGTYKFPETYVINAQGQVVEKFIGPENWLNPDILARIQRYL
ncbi:MAG: TlpA family protein disulfide reductase [Acidobacteria bacterium]|nr:TlpA family protein disulfide reductase [Acidobacteriota bacterium]